MKNLSRLTALLLALVMLLSITASATEISNYTKSDYDQDIQARISDFPNLPVEQQYSLIMSMEDPTQAEALIVSLSEEQYATLIDYAASLREYEPPKTVVFTDAGPFMPAVNVSPMRMMRMMAMAASTETDDGVFTSKKITGNAADGYTITLESYVTGETTVVTETKTTPVDIVLVLDQSGSMKYGFDGNSTSIDTARRQYAMKQAVNNFIEAVKKKYVAETSDHRMAIVTFGSEAYDLQGWTSVDNNGITTLQEKIGGLPAIPEGSTNVAAGMKKAETLMSSGYSYSGKNTDRQKVVIVFTDGVPTTSSDFDTGVATNAIASAKNLKDSGVTVYTVGIFNGADPSELYGEKWDYTLYSDIICTGEVGSYWGGSWLSELVGSNDFAGIDIAAGNRFLNYLSSNFVANSEIGLSRGSFNPSGNIGGSGTGYKITKNFSRTASSYYLTANDSSSLNNIFQEISSNIQTGSATVQLGSSTVVKDVVTDYFKLPTDANGNVDTSKIKVYTADYNKDGTWKARVASSLTPTVSGKTVSVTGFDFSANYCDTSKGRQDGNNNASGNFYGRKLIIEIPITVEPDFLGGNVVPTNGEDSGIYASDGKVAENFTADPAGVDVPVKTISFSVEDQNIYLSNVADLTKFQVNLDARVDGTDNDYVKVEYKVMDGTTVIATCVVPAGSTTGTWTAASGQTSVPVLDADKTYTVVCNVIPVNAGMYSAQNTSDTATVNVFKPVFEFKDTTIKYRADAPVQDAYNTGNKVSGPIWKHGDTASTDVTMWGTEPELALTYTPVSGIEGGKVTATDVVPVDVTVYRITDIERKDITSATTFRHSNCDCVEDCTWTAASGEFLLHVIEVVADLTITKTGLDEYAYDGDVDRESAIFKVVAVDKNGKEQTFWISLTNGQSVTIKDVLVNSTATITEQNSWTWRYKNVDPVSIPINKSGNNCTIVNEGDNSYWLGGDNYKVNVFGTK